MFLSRHAGRPGDENALTPQQVTQLRAISEAMIAASGGHGKLAFPSSCPSEDEPEESTPASPALR